jgi:hypothetical protein
VLAANVRHDSRVHLIAPLPSFLCRFSRCRQLGNLRPHLVRLPVRRARPSFMRVLRISHAGSLGDCKAERAVVVSAACETSRDLRSAHIATPGEPIGPGSAIAILRSSTIANVSRDRGAGSRRTASFSAKRSKRRDRLKPPVPRRRPEPPQLAVLRAAASDGPSGVCATS